MIKHILLKFYRIIKNVNQNNCYLYNQKFISHLKIIKKKIKNIYLIIKNNYNKIYKCYISKNKIYKYQNNTKIAIKMSVRH